MVHQQARLGTCPCLGDELLVEPLRRHNHHSRMKVYLLRARQLLESSSLEEVGVHIRWVLTWQIRKMVG
ncbi:nicotinate-nucleotide pyrophosphorylase [Moniliophthora roreri]|nr:nicotinate-nucleotide pyrophosphorylase [Moniliophthora roreri]